MSSPTQSDPANETTPPSSTRTAITVPDFSGTPQPIGELAGRADFPQCAHGEYVDIQGFSGVVVEIIGSSIKVRPVEGITQRFNVHRLKTLYAPTVIRPEPEMLPATATPAVATVMARMERSQIVPRTKPKPEPDVEEEPAKPARVYIENPDFTAPVLLINEYARQPDFPKCAYGKHVDIEGYTGVVVEFVKGSLKIHSPAGITRSYNAEVLRKNYGKV